MPGIKAKLFEFDFDYDGYMDTAFKKINFIFRKAAREYVRAALDRIPIRTGFLAGAFKSLEELTGGGSRPSQLKGLSEKFERKHNSSEMDRAKTVLEVFKMFRQSRTETGVPKQIAKKKDKFAGGGDFRTHRVTPGSNLGFERKGTGLEYYYPGKGVKVLKSPTTGRDFATPKDQIFLYTGDAFEFNFDINIIYYRINDFYGGHAPTAPWSSIEAGTRAFENYIKANMIDALPRMQDFFIQTEITVEGQSKTRRNLSLVQRPKAPPII